MANNKNQASLILYKEDKDRIAKLKEVLGITTRAEIIRYCINKVYQDKLKELGIK